MALKACTKCGNIKPLAEFSKRNDGTTQTQAWCKTCLRHYQLEYQARIRETKVSRQIAHGMCPECKNLTLIPWRDPVDLKRIGKVCGECFKAYRIKKGGIVTKNDN